MSPLDLSILLHYVWSVQDYPAYHRKHSPEHADSRAVVATHDWMIRQELLTHERPANDCTEEACRFFLTDKGHAFVEKVLHTPIN